MIKLLRPASALFVSSLALGCTPAEPIDPIDTTDGETTDDDTTDGPGDTSGGGTPGGEVTPELLVARGGCPEVDGPGTDHAQWITADEKWTAEGSPHRIPYNLRIVGTVTIDPCATVLLAPGVFIDLGSSTEYGSIVARGEVETLDDGTVLARPVTFDALESGTDWAQIVVRSGSEIELSVAALLHGGDTDFDPGALLLEGPAGGTNHGDVERNGTLDRVLIAESAGYGLNLEGYGALTEDSEQIWILDGGREAEPFGMHLEAGVAHTLPDSLVIDGNLNDAILVETNKTFMNDDTFRDHGVPYHMRGALFVAPPVDGPPATLTIEAGVTMEFTQGYGSGFIIGSTDVRLGHVQILGTADAPITFTSGTDSPAPGDWQGLYFRYTDYAQNRIEHTIIEYAGAESSSSSFGCGPGDNDSAILMYGQGVENTGPSEVFITDTSFDHIAGTTVIVSGWTAESGPDFSEGNTFGDDTPACRVSQPQRDGGGDTCDGGRDVCWG